MAEFYGNALLLVVTLADVVAPAYLVDVGFLGGFDEHDDAVSHT